MEDGGFSINIAVVGMGLIGGSYADALRGLKPKKIYGIDVDKSALDKALSKGIIDEGFTDGEYPLGKADFVIIALYPEDTVNFVKNNIKYFKTGAVITDTCGIKDMVIKKINSFLPDTLDFIGGHPMAGKESKGIENASKDIFINANYIITPQNKNKDKNIKLVENMARSIGCRSVVKISTEEHDRMISFTSHLPHIIAISLMNSDTCTDTAKFFVGGSFRDATRVAAINSKLWMQLFNLNSDNLAEDIENFENMLKIIKKAIKSHDNNTLENILSCADEKRRSMV